MGYSYKIANIYKLSYLNIFMNINEYLRNKRKFVEKLGDLRSK